MASSTATYTYGKFNRLTKAVVGATTTTYTYDANGNLATKNDGVYLWTYAYDYENRMTKVQQGTPTVEQMVYDGDGKAIQNVQTNTVVSIWKGFDIIYQKNLGTSLVIWHVIGNGQRAAQGRAQRCARGTSCAEEKGIYTFVPLVPNADIGRDQGVYAGRG